MLFDASTSRSRRTCARRSRWWREARGGGASVEGEIEAIKGVEDGIGSDEAAKRQSLEVAVDFIQRSGVDVFAPSIGNAHGVYSPSPRSTPSESRDLVAATRHTDRAARRHRHDRRAVHRPDRARLREGQHLDALKVTFMKSNLEFLRGAEATTSGTRPRCSATCARPSSRWPPATCDTFGSAGKAW